MSIEILIVTYAFVVLYKFFLNLFRFFRTKHFLDWYSSWLKTKEWDLVQYQAEVVELFKKANVTDASVPVVEPVGFGRVMTTTTSIFINFPSQDLNTATLLISCFHKAIGVYRRRIWQSINPFWWIEFLIFLPVNVINYLGLSSENITTKIFQLIYWVIGVGFTLALSLYPETIRAKVEQLFELVK